MFDAYSRIEDAHASAAGEGDLEETVDVGDDRALEAQRPWTARRPAEERRPAAELDPEIHDDPLPLGIDGRVRHLSERLTEVVSHGPIEAASARRRRVVAHAPDRIRTGPAHRLEHQPQVLGTLGNVIGILVNHFLLRVRSALSLICKKESLRLYRLTNELII